MWLEGDGPLVEELEMLLMLAAGRDTRRDTTLTTTTRFMGDFFNVMSKEVSSWERSLKKSPINCTVVVNVVSR
jgi:hypothetical protein